MPIPSDVPKQLQEELKSHLIGACQRAQAGYRSSKGKEDTVTGDLGGSLRLEPLKYVATANGAWGYAVRWNSFRSGKGRSGEERETGADGIFEFEVYRGYGEEVYTKGLLFQAKKDTDKDFSRLYRQCNLMEELVKGGSALIEYAQDHYVAMDAKSALKYQTRVSLARPDFEADGQSLGTYLTDRFLACDVGTENLYYDLETETLFVPSRNRAYRRIRAALDKINIAVYSPAAVEEAVRIANRRRR